jgi:hypothetical protein
MTCSATESMNEGNNVMKGAVFSLCELEKRKSNALQL